MHPGAQMKMSDIIQLISYKNNERLVAIVFLNKKMTTVIPICLKIDQAVYSLPLNWVIYKQYDSLSGLISLGTTKTKLLFVDVSIGHKIYSLLLSVQIDTQNMVAYMVNMFVIMYQVFFFTAVKVYGFELKTCDLIFL